MRLSVVVPTRNAARTLQACLDSVRAQTHPDVEVVVVDNHSTDRTVAIATPLADVVHTAGPERSAQRNRGAELATGEVLLFVDADMVLEPTVAAQVVAAFEADAGLGAVTVGERSFGDGFLAACRALEKQLYLGDADVEAPRAFRRQVFWATGGWDESLTAAEDWDLADRTRALGVGLGRVEAIIWHDEGRIDLRAQYRKKRYYGRWVALYLRRHPQGRAHLARPGTLRRARGLLHTPVHLGGLATLKAVESAGLVAGMRTAR